MHLNRTIVVAAALAGSVVACSSAAGETTATEPTASTSTAAVPTTVPLASIPIDYTAYRAQETACGSEQPPPVEPMQFAGPDDAAVSGLVTATLTTSCGPIVIELDADGAPETVNSFVFLAEDGYFDGVVSHRIIPGFMMQTGDPTATGRGGPGYVVPDELPDDEAPYQRGVVAMANAGSDTGGSQFFILFGPADWLPPAYSVFGMVTDGYETLDAIEALPLAINPVGGDRTPSVPLESLYIESISIER